MAHFGDRRKSTPSLIPSKAKEDAMNQLYWTWHSVINNADFQSDIKNDRVIRAIKHWSGEVRLGIEDAKLLQDDFRVMATFRHIQILQQLCKTVGEKLPLLALLNLKECPYHQSTNSQNTKSTIQKRKNKKSSKNKTSSIQKQKNIHHKEEASMKWSIHSNMYAVLFLVCVIVVVVRYIILFVWISD